MWKIAGLMIAVTGLALSFSIASNVYDGRTRILSTKREPPVLFDAKIMNDPRMIAIAKEFDSAQSRADAANSAYPHYQIAYTGSVFLAVLSITAGAFAWKVGSRG